MRAPKVFISYSHDSEPHKEWVRKLAADLRSSGIDVVLDQWDLSPGQDVSLFMQKNLTASDRVIVICSSNYVNKSNAGSGGAGYERMILSIELVSSIDTKKFVPILRNNDLSSLPIFLGPRLYIDFRLDDKYDPSFLALTRELHGVAPDGKPPLGPNPFSGTPIAVPASLTSVRSLDEPWFEAEAVTAHGGLTALHLEGAMEVRACISGRISKSQIELVEAVRSSQVHTFGWPIGVLIETREEYRPRPYADGIRARIAVDQNSRQTFDCWSFRSNCDFYFLGSLFEDSRKEKSVFFDTRMIRVTEALMLVEACYRKLGVSLDENVILRIRHTDLAGRSLVSASPNRMLFPKSTTEREFYVDITTKLGTMHENRVEDVKRLLSPLFMLFDFQTFSDNIYSQIVRDFENGIIR